MEDKNYKTQDSNMNETPKWYSRFITACSNKDTFDLHKICVQSKKSGTILYADFNIIIHSIMNVFTYNAFNPHRDLKIFLANVRGGIWGYSVRIANMLNLSPDTPQYIQDWYLELITELEQQVRLAPPENNESNVLRSRIEIRADFYSKIIEMTNMCDIAEDIKPDVVKKCSDQKNLEGIANVLKTAIGLYALNAFIVSDNAANMLDILIDGMDDFTDYIRNAYKNIFIGKVTLVQVLWRIINHAKEELNIRPYSEELYTRLCIYINNASVNHLYGAFYASDHSDDGYTKEEFSACIHGMVRYFIYRTYDHKANWNTNRDKLKSEFKEAAKEICDIIHMNNEKGEEGIIDWFVAELAAFTMEEFNVAEVITPMS